MSRFKDQSGESVTGLRSGSIKGQRGQSGGVVGWHVAWLRNRQPMRRIKDQSLPIVGRICPGSGSVCG